MGMSDKVNILMVDDQPAKLLSYEAMLGDLGENLIPATSGYCYVSARVGRRRARKRGAAREPAGPILPPAPLSR
jgi:hypothetical protein